MSFRHRPTIRASSRLDMELDLAVLDFDDGCGCACGSICRYFVSNFTVAVWVHRFLRVFA